MMARLGRWAVYLLTLAGLCAFAVNYTGWFSSYLFYAVLILPIFSLLLTLWPYFAIRLSISAPIKVEREESAEIRITANAKGCPYFLPVTLSVLQYRVLYDRTAQTHKAHRYRFVPFPVLQMRGKVPVLRAAGGLRIPLDTSHTTVVHTEIRSAVMHDFLGLFPLRIRLRGRFAASSVLDLAVLPKAAAPTGKLQMWDNSQSMLTPTQRPSEQYEIRTYHPGDALRSVHWKLSAKTDDLLVRESVEAQVRVLAITLDRPQAPQDADSLYDGLDYMLRTLCVQNRVQAVVVAWVTEEQNTCTETIYDLSRLDSFYKTLLSTPPPDVLPQHAFASVYKNIDRGYHLNAAACAADASPTNVMNAGNDNTPESLQT